MTNAKRKCLFSILLFLTTYFLIPHKTFASTLFRDDFGGSEGTPLSTHNSSWSFIDYEPGTGRWGEYQIHSNKAGDGSGTVYNINKLNIKLPGHFVITENFSYSSTVSSDPNLAFLDIKLDNAAGDGEYLFRFQVNQPQNSTTLSTFGPVTTSSSLGTYNTSGDNLISIEYNFGDFVAKINGTEVLAFNSLLVTPDHLIIDQTRFVPTALVNFIQIDDLSSPPPTPTPTPAPTPFPIAHFSQRNPIWKDRAYDNATSWSPSNPTIERWGCSVTAASTILDYYGIHSLPGGDVNNPGNLNTWLNTQSDGFFRAGALNWNAVARISKLASMDSPTIPALEYKFKTRDVDDLHSRLGNLQPVILEEPGHYVTAYQFDPGTNTTNIVDPFWGNTRATLSSYSDTFLSSRTFTPSHTNLGYIFSESDSDISSTLYFRHGSVYELINTVASHTIQPLSDPDHTLAPSTQPFQLLEYAQPQDGSYQVHLKRSSPGKGTFSIYSYDVSGNPSISSFVSLFGTSDQIVTVSYTASGSSTIRKNVSFDTLRQDIITARDLHEFRFKYQGTDLLKLLDVVERLYSKYPPISKDTISLFVRVFVARKPFMSQSIYDMINADAKLLLLQIY